MKNRSGILTFFVCSYLLLVGAATAWAANNKCCYWKSKESGCSGCVGYDSNGDDAVDYYMNIGDHGAKRCKNGENGDNCTESLRECAVVTMGTTKYKIGILCKDQDGVTMSDISIETEQCAASDTPCAGS